MSSTVHGGSTVVPGPLQDFLHQLYHQRFYNGHYSDPFPTSALSMSEMKVPKPLQCVVYWTGFHIVKCLGSRMGAPSGMAV